MKKPTRKGTGGEIDALADLSSDEGSSGVALRKAPPPWTSQLLTRPTKTGETVRTCVANATTIIAHDDPWTGVLAYDEFADAIVCRKRPPWRDHERGDKHANGDWLDADTTRMQAWISQRFAIDVSPSVAFDAVRVVAHRTTVHPVRDYLSSLRWDGKQRVPTWIVDLLGAVDTPVARFAASSFMVSAVARVLAPGCKVDTMPILESVDQGMGKSSVLRAIFGDAWHLELSVADVLSKDAMQILRRKWGAELPEIDGLSKGDAAHVKSYASRQVDTYRASYAKCSRDYPRQIVFCGTTNASAYLRDETGARRFLPVVCSPGDPSARARRAADARDQLWAEAVARYQSSERWHVEDPELASALAEEQSARYQADPWEQRIGEWLASRVDGALLPKAVRGVTTAEALEFALKLDVGRWTRPDEMRAAATMRRLGWVAGKQELRGGARVRPYRPKDALALDGTGAVVLHLHEPDEDEPSLPFMPSAEDLAEAE